MNKKVLFVNSSLSCGGSEHVMSNIANEFLKNNYDVTMILIRDGFDDSYSIDNKLHLIRFHYKFNNKLYKFISRIIKLHREFKKDYDYVISFMIDVNLCSIIANVGVGKKMIVSERADPSRRSKVKRFLERILYTRAYKVVFQTEYVKQFYSQKILEKSVVIPNPICEDLPKMIDYNKKKNIICAAGRFKEQKRFDILIKSFSDVVKKHQDYKLIIFGEGNLRKKYEDLINNLELQQSVLLPGYVSNVTDKMNECKIYVSSSEFEGISNSMLEAMALGLPSICTDCPVGGARMVIKNNVNGILISVNDEENLTRNMLELIENKEKYERISKESVKVRDRFSIKKIMKQWLEICK